MSTARKAILTATFGPYVKQDPSLIASYGGEDNIKNMIMASIKHANDAGFDVDNIAFNPQDPEDSIKRFREKLRGRQYDGLLIGWGIRGSKDYTSLFEAAVNVAKEVAPQTRLLFGNAPDDLMNALRRNFSGLE